MPRQIRRSELKHPPPPLPVPHYDHRGRHHPHHHQESGEDDGHGRHYQYTQQQQQQQHHHPVSAHRQHHTHPTQHHDNIPHPQRHHQQQPQQYQTHPPPYPPPRTSPTDDVTNGGGGGVYLRPSTATGIGRSLSNLADAAEASAGDRDGGGRRGGATTGEGQQPQSGSSGSWNANNNPYRDLNSDSNHGDNGFPLPPNPTQQQQQEQRQQQEKKHQQEQKKQHGDGQKYYDRHRDEYLGDNGHRTSASSSSSPEEKRTKIGDNNHVNGQPSQPKQPQRANNDDDDVGHHRRDHPPHQGHPPPPHHHQQSYQRHHPQPSEQQHQQQHWSGRSTLPPTEPVHPRPEEEATAADFQPADGSPRASSSLSPPPRNDDDGRQEESNNNDDGMEQQHGGQLTGGSDGDACDGFSPPPPHHQRGHHQGHPQDGRQHDHHRYPQQQQQHPSAHGKQQRSDGGEKPSSWDNNNAASSQHHQNRHQHHDGDAANDNRSDHHYNKLYPPLPPHHQHHHYPYYHQPPQQQQQHPPYPPSPHDPHALRPRPPPPPPPQHHHHPTHQPPPNNHAHHGAHPPPHSPHSIHHHPDGNSPHPSAAGGGGGYHEFAPTLAGEKRPFFPPPNNHHHHHLENHDNSGYAPPQGANHGHHGHYPPHPSYHRAPHQLCSSMDMPTAKRSRLNHPHPPRGRPPTPGGYARPQEEFGQGPPIMPPNRNTSNNPANFEPRHPNPSKAAATTKPNLNHYHLPKSRILPVYKYSTAHQAKSWDEMIALFEQFVEREGHGDVERDDCSRMAKAVALADEEDEGAGKGVRGGAGLKDVGITVHEGKSEHLVKSENQLKKSPEGGQKESIKEVGKVETDESGDDHANLPLDSSNSNLDDDDDEALMLRSWVREVRWVIRAEGLGQDDKFPRVNDKKKERCDSEAITPERLSQLEHMPDFPLLRNNHKNNNKSNDNNQQQHHPNQHRSAFGRWIDDLMHYRAKNGGDSNVPLKYAEHPGLGNFVNRQRTEYRKLLQGKASSMTRNKIRELDQVDFTWSVREGGHASWDSRLDELRGYKKTYGHTNVPKNYPPNPSLGYWVNEQRFQYRRWIRGKTSYMNPTKMAHLNSINFKWTLRESKRPWEEWMEELKKYEAEHGHVNVPLKYEKNVPLGSFVNNQRSEYRRMRQGKPSSMTETKVQELEGIGFLWNVRDARTPWHVRLEELKEYKKKHGDCNVPNNWLDNQPLSSWVSKQRQQYKLYSRRAGGVSTSCHLTKERVGQLNKLGFDWRYPSAVVPKNAFVPPTSADGGSAEPTLPAPAAAAPSTMASAAVVQ